MKRVLALILALIMVCALCACGSTAEKPSEAPETAVSAAPEAAESTEAAKETYVIRISDTNNEDSLQGATTKMLFDLVAEKTDGQVVPEYYWSGSLGDKTASMEGLRAHTIQVAQIAATDLATYSPGWSVFSLPYLFGGSADTELACYKDPEFLEFLDSSVESSGFKVLIFNTTGYRNPMNTIREVRSPEDAKGIRIRVLQNTYLAEAFEKMGFTPVALGWSEVYSALQQGTVDGAEQSAALLLDNQLADYGKYLTMLDAIGICGMYVMDLDFYNSLPENVQQAIDEACIETMEWEWSAFAEYDASALESLIEKGVQVTYLTDEEKAVFVDAISGIKDEMFADTPETEEFYNQIQAAIDRVS